MRTRPHKLALLLSLALCHPVTAKTAKRVLLLGQKPDGHPPGTHEYLRGLRVIAKTLEGAPGLDVSTVSADEPWKGGPELIDGSDAVVIFLSEGARWLSADPARLAAMRRLAARGGGFVGIHWGIGTRDAKNIAGFLELVGACHGGPDRRYKVVETTLEVSEHPITTGVHDLALREELYYRLKFAKPTGSVTPILTAEIEGVREVVSWAWTRPDGGRSFGYSGVHFHESWKHPEYRRLIAQGVLWTLDRPIPPGGIATDIAKRDLRPLPENPIFLDERRRSRRGAVTRERSHPTQIDPSRTAVVVCDMWTKHWCAGATRRCEELAPRIDALARKLRERGALIVHSPSSGPGGEFAYETWPQHRIARDAPRTEIVVVPREPPEGWKNLFGPGWCGANALREATLPLDASDNGCDCPAKCSNGPGKMDCRQSPVIQIARGDAVAAGVEAIHLLRQRGIETVLIAGVHLNLCMMGRPFGIRNLVYQDFRVLLVRDLTDTLYNPRMPPMVSHHGGTALMVEHVETYWCGSITSDQILGGEPFRLSDDGRQRAVGPCDGVGHPVR